MAAEARSAEKMGLWESLFAKPPDLHLGKRFSQALGQLSGCQGHRTVSASTTGPELLHHQPCCAAAKACVFGLSEDQPCTQSGPLCCKATACQPMKGSVCFCAHWAVDGKSHGTWCSTPPGTTWRGAYDRQIRFVCWLDWGMPIQYT